MSHLDYIVEQLKHTSIITALTHPVFPGSCALYCSSTLVEHTAGHRAPVDSTTYSKLSRVFSELKIKPGAQATWVCRAICKTFGWCLVVLRGAQRSILLKAPKRQLRADK